MKVTYYGHSVVLVESENHNILIDPFLNGNDSCPITPEDLPNIDVILLTHGHNDHVGDTVSIAKKHDAQVVAIHELATYLGWQGLNTHPMSLGGGFTFDFGHVELTRAYHSSSYIDEENNIIYTGMPAGILLTLEGKTIFHAGDTALFSDMKLIGERRAIDLAFLPIGDNFTMGPEDAAKAAEWIQAKKVVPVHYNTFPVIEQDPKAFADKLGGSGKVMDAGESIEL